MKIDIVERNGSFDDENARNTFKKVLKTMFLALSWVCLVSCMLFSNDIRCTLSNTIVPVTFTNKNIKVKSFKSSENIQRGFTIPKGSSNAFM